MLSTLKHLSRITLFGIITVALLLTQVGGASALGPRSQVNAQLVNYAIVFVSRKIQNNGSLYMTPSETGSMPGVGPYSRFQVSAPGKLVVREADGTLRNLVDGSKPTTASLNLIDVNAPDVSYDGTRIVFAGLVKGTYETGHLTNPGAWRIYTINVDGTGLRQVTVSDRENLDLSQFKDVGELFKKYDDTDPAWMPDGRIVFSSTRWPSFGQYGGSRTTNLYMVNANGTGMHRITSERSGADRPQVDPLTGKIVYSRWWRNFRVAIDSMQTIADPQGGYIMKDGLLSIVHSKPPPNMNEVGGFKNLDRNSWQLATINPDGTGLTQWGGRSSTYFYGQMANHAYGGGFGQDGTFYANFFPMNNMTEAAGFGGIRSYIRGPNGYRAIIGVNKRDDSTQPLVRYNPPSHGVYVSNYAAEAEALPDGRLVISWAKDIKQDYGLYIINSNGSGLTKLYDNPGTTELRARVIQPRPLPPIIADAITQVASPLPPLAQGPYDAGGTFTFQALNVYFNAPVDTDILSAMPVGSAGTIRFFIDHQRWQQNGSHESLDWPILLKELPVDTDGSVTTMSPADVPLFEQIRTAKPGYTVPLTGRTVSVQEMGGAAHVAGMNFGRPGEVVRCVGCHAGHSMIPVPANDEDAQWTNLAPGATVKVSSLNSSLPNSNGLIDRRVKMPFSPNTLHKYWFSKAGSTPTTQWVQLTFPVPVTVRTVRLYGIPAADSSVKVLNSTVYLYADAEGKYQIGSRDSGALSVNGTDVAFNDIYARSVRVEFKSVSGGAAGLGEVEVIARGERNVPLRLISGNIGIADTAMDYAGGEVTTNTEGSYIIPRPQGWTGTIAPSHSCFTFLPSSITYSNLTLDQVAQDYTARIDPAAGCADIDVSAGQTDQGRYGVPAAASVQQRYAGVNDGPLNVVSNNNLPIIASQRVIFGGRSYSEMMGLPAEQLSNEYWFPYYNNVAMDSQLRVSNLGDVPTTITVTLGGAQIDSYTLAAGAATRRNYPGMNSGPLKVHSSATDILSTVRVLYGGKSYSELMGLPVEQLTDEYLFPYYNNVAMDSQLRVSNLGDVPTTITVYLGGQEIDSYTLAANSATRKNYPGMNSGPLKVHSSATDILSTIRVLYKAKSYSELMGFPSNQLAREYSYPVYDNVSLDSQLRVSNVGSASTTITVYTGSTKIDTYQLAAGAATRKNYAGKNTGPLRVVSSAEPILSTIRMLYGISLYEMTGLPNTQLSARYYFPWYNNTAMNSQLRFAVP